MTKTETLPPFQATDSHAIDLKGVTLKYPETVALERLSGRFKPNTMTAIIGPNGGGKSSLIKAIMGLIPLQAGKINLNGIQKSQIAYLPQQSKIDRTFPLTVYDVVSMGLCQSHGFFKKIDGAQQIQTALEKVGLNDCSDRSIQALSGGQFQKILFARLWLQQADVILLDEPFAGIDRHTTEDLVDLLKTWNSEGKSIIAVLHHFDLVKEHFPETLLLARRLIGWGKTETILTRANLDKAIEQSRFWETTRGDISQSETNILAVEP